MFVVLLENPEFLELPKSILKLRLIHKLKSDPGSKEYWTESVPTEYLFSNSMPYNCIFPT